MSKVKRILAVVLAMAMVMAMSVVSFAAITGASIKVKGLSTAADQTVSIYEIYRLDDNNNLWVKQDWATAIEAPGDLEDATKLDALKGLTENISATDTKTSNTGEVTFENLQAGAYLVVATDTANKTTYNTMVAVTYKYDEDTRLMVADDAEVVAKASGYNIGKTNSDADKVVEVGDLIEYTIKTTVPYVQKDETATFKVTDTLIGATYYLGGDPVKGVAAVSSVTVGGSTIEGISIPAEAHGAKTFTVNMDSLVSAENTYAGQEVVITYTAKVEAVDEITNTATSTHVPVPEGNVTKAYTGQLEILKYGEGDKANTLEGATFAVYRLNDAGDKEYAAIDANGYVTGVWVEEVEDGEVPDGAGTITTGAAGTAVVKGLDVGTYYFKETVAPDGYSINDTDVNGEITKTETEGVVTVSGNAEMNDTKLASLPSTGGAGIIVFTIVGCLIMIAAATMFFLSGRKKEE